MSGSDTPDAELKRQLNEKRKDTAFMERIRKSRERWAAVLEKLRRDGD